jgi:hypothetical protein
MLWIVLALILALPVLLGLVPGTDATGAQRLVLRCSLAGGAVGLLASGLLVIASPHIPLGANLAFPVLWGAIIGAGIGLLGIVVRRFVAGWRT